MALATPGHREPPPHPPVRRSPAGRCSRPAPSPHVCSPNGPWAGEAVLCVPLQPQLASPALWRVRIRAARACARARAPMRWVRARARARAPLHPHDASRRATR
eukprot:6201616-Pleurochrysis_carterae.AAC.1